MGERIGLIQTRGIGDIIIALPIADHFLERGAEVYWPIDEAFLPAFAAAKPQVHFLPVNRADGYFFARPLKMLQDLNCTRIISLYNYHYKLKVYDDA